MKLWTHDFIRIYLSNLLLFASLYMLLPVLPMYLVERFDTSLSIAGGILALFALSQFLLGPFYSYFIDTFRRKNVCMLSFLAVIAIVGGYSMVGTLLWVAVLRIIQGALFGVATTMGSTLAIDITNTSRRSEANTCFGWAARLGMVFGAMIGLLLYKYEGLQQVLYASIILGGIGLIFVSLIHVPFRAPIGAPVCSLDRFLLLRGWLPAINLILVSFVFGMLLTTINMYTESVQMQEMTLHFFILLAGGFVLAMIANKHVFENADIRARVVSGLLLMGASLLLIITHVDSLALMTAAVMMGLGLGLVSSDFLLILVKLSEHCQRGTANTTYLLAWELGVALGVAVGCYLIDISSYISVFQVGIVAVILALGFYLGLTNPYFKKHKLR
ncbi:MULTISPECIES: MFS transporter [unclassified Bacteroides]|jgi:predicted MFS family arabinose efflux permease|uniref:MFS transporter n=1 Tax=unclassified Bacteroides TaxID=2646097 RepID=UPI000E9E6921|nr:MULTISPECIES: MFS transporter [unclassified Bacteroides]RGN47581.1 MFS transporter [Bacteroides sp. OM05-12]RHR75401.1 MFS transporter [Bacteroides sp. AF16-49]